MQEAQNKMKRVYDAKHREREFMIGDMIYLKLQPYKQHSLFLCKNIKISAKYCGPLKVLQRIGAVAYKLELPKDARIHPVTYLEQSPTNWNCLRMPEYILCFICHFQETPRVAIQPQFPTMNEVPTPKPISILPFLITE
ncbi:Ty3/gypsy retrotransposon protein [Quillaja saponaria]|uniref:Ty3/gypsy retrotransposon protein n=1 Tax=Quillaja saponaria TaxID=32244 RepID=A0AAD7L2D3_QUISA|nr:Ty3/gypsy retrotransposon protein [Quillaja saponaria]